MNRKSFTLGFIAGVIFMAAFTLVAWTMVRAKKTGAARREDTDAARLIAGDKRVAALLEPICRKHNVPAIAALLLNSDGSITAAAVGVRKRGTDVAVTLDDLWHLGSCSKAMTATLVAKLVEQRRLKWDSTVSDIFPEDAPHFDPDLQSVTVLQLLWHRAGLPANADWDRFTGDDVKQERLRVVQTELAKAASQQPGTYQYSNLGYVIAGAIVEKVTGKTWEEAVREEVFLPLEMKSAGFGGVGTPGRIDAPWPHTGDGRPSPANGPEVDNPPVMGPAGRIHCTIRDWAKFIQDQLRGDRGERALLKPESYRTLHTPPVGGDYALGWNVVQRPWGGGTVLNHSGDNTLNYANVWVAPKRGFAVLLCVNQSGSEAFQATDDAASALIQLQQAEAKP